ncbi:MAG: aminotransferase class V-fold PLP-dependent enzyme [Cyclobacteriaceae bacterium]|nr:aminotransferase class V-fold PLP-dependent enzyme [Cyclobacteriaceae bacterium]
MEISPDPKYFDYAASSPPWPEALDAYIKSSTTYYANPSSLHRHGKEAKRELLILKKTFCDLLNFFDGRLLLCASGTEANNTIIDGHMKMFPEGRLLIAEDVHDSIWYATKKYKKSVEVLNIDRFGQIQIDELDRALTREITLVCINHVSNETGTVHPVMEMADLCSRRKIKILIDGTQSLGHLPINLDAIPFNYFSFSAHKFGGVKSTGGVLIRDDQFRPLISGGKQEWDLRAGTEDIAGLAAMVVALKKCLDCVEEETIRLNILKKSILEHLKKQPHVLINSPGNSLPGILSVSIPGMTGRELVAVLSHSGFAISTGSACHANQLAPSRIITAMGRNKMEAIGSIRISMGFGTTDEAVNNLVKTLLDLIN